MICDKCKKNINDNYYELNWYNYDLGTERKTKVCRICYNYLEYYNQLNFRVNEVKL